MKKVSSFSKGIAVGSFLTIALITIAVLLFLFVSRQEDTPETTPYNVANIQIYDDTVIAGSEVINALRKYANMNQFGVLVITDKNSAGQWYGNELDISQDVNNESYGSVIAPDTKVGSINQTMDPEDNQFINKSGIFESVIVTDKSNVVRGLIFTQSQ